MKTISSKLLRQADGQSAEEQQLAACWPAFLICLRAATNSPRLINLQEMTEFLLNLLPRIDLTVRSDLTQAVNLLLQLTIQQRSDGMAANRELVARLLEAGCEPNLLRTVLELLDRDVQWLDTGEELVSLSRLLRDQGDQCEENCSRKPGDRVQGCGESFFQRQERRDDCSIQVFLRPPVKSGGGQQVHSGQVWSSCYSG